MNIRTRGILQFLGSGLAFGTWLWMFSGTQGSTTGHNGETPGGPLAPFFMAATGGFAAAGLLQAITGTPFSEMSEKWNALERWQRGLYGLLVFISGLVLLFGGLMLYGWMTSN